MNVSKSWLDEINFVKEFPKSYLRNVSKETDPSK
jgi:hypothetical protein